MRCLMPLLLALMACMLCSCPGGGQKTGGEDAAPRETVNNDAVSESGDTAASQDELISRGEAIFTGTDYSNTGLTCAHCHAASPEQETEQKFIAHTAYGAATRGAWKISSEAELAAKSGYAKTLADAANACISAPYMNHDERLTEADAQAIEAYLVSISQPDAWDAQPFIIARATALPVGGLKPDKANGKRLYEQSCEKCHDAGIEGLEELHGAKDWLSPVQVMAKVRKLKNWYDGYESQSYALSSNDASWQAFLLSIGASSAIAQENPCAETESAGEHAEGEEGHHEEGEDEGDIFGPDAMPFYGTDILTDQEVVDVAFYVAEEV